MENASDTQTQYPVLTVTKSELRQILGCNSNSRWKTKVMTDEVLATVLQIDRAQFNQVREFTVLQTRALAIFFKNEFETYFKK